MKRPEENLGKFLVILAILTVLAFPVVGRAQTAQATPTPAPGANSEDVESNVGIHVEAFTDAVKFTSGKGTGTDAGFRVPITARNSLIIDELIVPAAGSTFTFGQWEYRERLDHIFSHANVLVPLNAIQVSVYGGLGTRRGADITSPEFAYTGGGKLSVAVGNMAGGVVVLDFRAGYIGSAGVKLPLFTNTGTAAMGASLKF